MPRSELKKILWLSWKDMSHPQAGGAEVVKEQISCRLAKLGYEIILITSAFPGAQHSENRDGYRIVRVGNRATVYWAAYRFYREHLRGWPDLIIDEVNTIPFLAKYYAQEKNILLVHQLARKVWFYQLPVLLGLVGYLLEPIYLWFLRDRRVITVSESTCKDLCRFGFRRERVFIISEGIDISPVNDLSGVKKYELPTLLSMGSVRPMKRTAHILRAFELAKNRVSDLQLVIAGDMSGRYGSRLLEQIKRSPYRDSIHCVGRVDRMKKIELMQRCHVLGVTSVKEGWGLVVTEANSQGTPAVVYDVDGLRDSTIDGESGIIAKGNTPDALSDAIVNMLTNSVRYTEMQKTAWAMSQTVTFDRSAHDFIQVLNRL
jgi:glycosyltransferase involved in cell wall biosynthesis